MRLHAQDSAKAGSHCHASGMGGDIIKLAKRLRTACSTFRMFIWQSRGGDRQCPTQEARQNSRASCAPPRETWIVNDVHRCRTGPSKMPYAEASWLAPVLGRSKLPLIRGFERSRSDFGPRHLMVLEATPVQVARAVRFRAAISWPRTMSRSAGGLSSTLCHASHRDPAAAAQLPASSLLATKCAERLDGWEWLAGVHRAVR